MNADAEKEDLHCYCQLQIDDAAAVTVLHAETGGDDENRQQRRAAAHRSQTQLGLAAVMTTTNTYEISNINAHCHRLTVISNVNYYDRIINEIVILTSVQK